MVEVVSVDLSAHDAAMFKAFQQHYEHIPNILKLLNARAFEIKNGSFVAHLDASGNIKRVDRHDAIFIDALK